MVALYLRRKGLRNQDPSVPPLDRGSRSGGHGAAIRRVSPESACHSHLQRMARPVLIPLTMKLRGKCGRAERGRPGSRSIGRLPGRLAVAWV
jgi:hypothetical protein